MVGSRIFKFLTVVFLFLISLPIILGFIWLFISTFSIRTFGLIPVDSQGHIGGLTLSNWKFLADKTIWLVTLNTLILAIGLTAGVIIVSALAGYALSRMNFSGRRTILSLSLMLHAFPSVTLLIAIYFVLRWISKIPIIGNGLPVIGGFGYDTLGGVILVSIALQLPLGVWLMKGFFDNVSWDMEMAALIDGCSRFRILWQIILPQIKPGIAALAIFSFIEGWSSFLIPYSFMTSASTATVATYLNSLLSDSAPVNYGTLAAVGLFQLLPVLIFFIFTQKYMLNIFSGGVKGSS
ncbi:carbohydrate ABC transporter permease [Desulfurobacterium atlanticum]|uniref:Maltose/maltodextrin transport system permease protein MalG n=1 Tax=Desulfurobacterium atlanticum TaxID=240169 RepID=A0A238YBZ5_9BACT|nr:carbohydrate ABC transporter permease [Desulfurobacterium atlanticum]SNR68765.1 carbohydrate ABC transporter membrane protein 2, CUT1 family [Desulfurobacterium atlanticum]